jgi:hypothetical protein
MGGSSSAQEVKSTKAPIKDFINDPKVKEKAEREKKDAALLAYAHQKNYVSQNNDIVKQRTRDEKKMALMEQEQALQDRIDKAAAEMERA